VAAVGEGRITYDARGSPKPKRRGAAHSEVDGDRETFDARDSTRLINLELRRLMYEEGVRIVTVLNPGAKALDGVGILKRCRITFDGSIGYFGCGLIDGPPNQQHHRTAWLVVLREHDVRRVVVDHKAGSLTGAALRGGDLVVKGASAQPPASYQKGGTIMSAATPGRRPAL